MQRPIAVIQLARRRPHPPAAPQRSYPAIARGATLAVTEITPCAPASTVSRAEASSPLSTTKPAGTCSSISRTRDTCGTASLTAATRGSCAMRPTVAGSMSTAVRDGTLYAMTGTREAAATAS